jgi:hypothetical protein
MLVHAAVTDNVQLYEKALAAGADPAEPFSNGSNAFLVAAANGSINVLRLIYERTPKLLNVSAGTGPTLAWPLFMGLMHQEVLEQLLDWGAVCCSYKQNQAQDESQYPVVGRISRLADAATSAGASLCTGNALTVLLLHTMCTHSLCSAPAASHCVHLRTAPQGCSHICFTSC